MTSVAVWNVGLLVIALGASTAVAWGPQLRVKPAPVAMPVGSAAPSPPLVDHGGTEVPRASYLRIASASTLADAVLLEVCEPDRILSVTGYSARSSSRSYRFAGKATVEAIGDLEKLLALHPDLVLVSSFGDPRPVARLRDAGLRVFDLGPMRGLSTLVPNIREIAALVGHPERGERMVEAQVAEMSAVAADIPAGSRRRGMYLNVYGGHVFGGGQGTSYHDVLTAAGLLDAAAGYRDWPEYSAEQILAADPDVIVTDTGMRARICEHAGFAPLRACASPNGIVAIDDGLLGDPGPAMLEAAQAIRRAVYGETRSDIPADPQTR